MSCTRGRRCQPGRLAGLRDRSLAPSHRASSPGAIMAAGKKIASGRTRAGPVVIPWAAGDTGTTGPGGDDIRAVRRAAADPVRGSKA
ncbi:MAG TPA: hypothetical protein VG123_11770, partial [Streptosporangiaceae bacterium]|nr:hypothetical protein [Streptosporangiaceae bacterium]